MHKLLTSTIIMVIMSFLPVAIVGDDNCGKLIRMHEGIDFKRIKDKLLRAGFSEKQIQSLCSFTLSDAATIQRLGRRESPDEAYIVQLKQGGALYLSNIGGLISCVRTIPTQRDGIVRIPYPATYFYTIKEAYKQRKETQKKILLSKRNRSQSVP